jgi:DNA-3-methyladenine glycosylase I
MEKHRCDWGNMSPKMQAYHDFRWCKPVHEDTELFTMLILEGAQAGLSWSTIIEREDNYRRVFDEFDPSVVAGYDEEKIQSLMQDPEIIRNRRKIEAAVTNARAFLKIQEEYGRFDTYIWSFTGGDTYDHQVRDMSEVPATSELSEKVSKDLKNRGLKFVGPTIIYSYLQGIGIYSDHSVDCEFR